jgi:hypothetical protein
VRAEAWILRPATPSTLVARRLGRFVGEVADPGGQPVAAATVTFTRPVGEGHDETSALPLMTTTTTTDADGRFSAAWIERPPCDPCQEAAGGCAVADLRTADAFVLSVRAPGHGPAQQTLAVEDAEGFDDDAPLRIVLPHSADIASGRLVDEAGHGYPRAYVLARSTERPAEQRRADVAGENFELDGLGDGPYDLRAIQDGVVLAEATGVVAGQDVTMTGRPRADGPDVVLTVVDDEGRPVRARIDGGPFRDAATGDDGKVTATRVLPGDVALRIRIVGGEPFVHTISIPAPTPSDPEPARVPVRVRVAAPG